jgi:hypothetical protein
MWVRGQLAMLAAREELAAAAETASAVNPQRALQGLDSRLRAELHQQLKISAAVEQEKMAQACTALRQVVAERRKAAALKDVLSGRLAG